MANFIKALQARIVELEEEVDDLQEHIEAFKTIARATIAAGIDERPFKDQWDEIQRLTAENAKLKRRARANQRIDPNTPNVWHR
jgi:hypothetical protein